MTNPNEVKETVARLRQAAGPRTADPVNVSVAVQNVHEAADQLEALEEERAQQTEDAEKYHDRALVAEKRVEALSVLPERLEEALRDAQLDAERAAHEAFSEHEKVAHTGRASGLARAASLLAAALGEGGDE